MEFNFKEIQQQYQGFLSTNVLWKNELIGLQQLKLPPINTTIFNGTITKTPRLGKRVESFVSCYLKQYESIEILKENIQIQKDKITIGELDCLFLEDDKPIHLEIIYKFYLFDNTVGNTEIEHWIGPNRKDSLQQKLEKLATKQLPLLYKKECEQLLKQIHFNIDEIQQKVLFKSQLFVPLNTTKINFKHLNSNCVSGFYTNKKELQVFKECKFYIPSKMNWLLEPTLNVDWQNYTTFKKQVSEILEQKTSPLCWFKKQNGEIFKFFLVWW